MRFEPLCFDITVVCANYLPWRSFGRLLVESIVTAFLCRNSLEKVVCRSCLVEAFTSASSFWSVLLAAELCLWCQLSSCFHTNAFCMYLMLLTAFSCVLRVECWISCSVFELCRVLQWVSDLGTLVVLYLEIVFRPFDLRESFGSDVIAVHGPWSVGRSADDGQWMDRSLYQFSFIVDVINRFRVSTNLLERCILLQFI